MNVKTLFFPDDYITSFFNIHTQVFSFTGGPVFSSSKDWKIRVSYQTNRKTESGPNMVNKPYGRECPAGRALITLNQVNQSEGNFSIKGQPENWGRFKKDSKTTEFGFMAQEKRRRGALGTCGMNEN